MRALALLVPLVVLAASTSLVWGPAGDMVYVLPAAEPVAAAGPAWLEDLAFGAPVLIEHDHPLGFGPTEPVMAIDPSGGIFVSGTVLEGTAAPTWYSTDGGASFEPLATPGGIRERGAGAEGHFATDGANVYFVDTAVASMVLSRWSGSGASWSYTVPTAAPPVNDRPWLASLDGDLYVYVNHGAGRAIYKSQDEGLTWMQTFPTLPEVRNTSLFPGYLVANPALGSLHVVGRCVSGLQDPTLCAMASFDAGASWQWSTLGEAPSGALAFGLFGVAVDDAGRVYTAFTDDRAGGCDVYLASSADGLDPWTVTPFAAGDGCNTFPWLANAAEGVVVSWYHNPANARQDEVPVGSEWRVRVALLRDDAVHWGELPAAIHAGPLERAHREFMNAATGPDGRIHLAFTDTFTPQCLDSLVPPVYVQGENGGRIRYGPTCLAVASQTGGPLAR